MFKKLQKVKDDKKKITETWNNYLGVEEEEEVDLLHLMQTAQGYRIDETQENATFVKIEYYESLGMTSFNDASESEAK